MSGPLRAIITALALLLPLIAVALNWSLLQTAAAIIALLAVRWAVQLAGLLRTPRHPVILHTLTMSHFAEKVRWCLDSLGLEYKERPCLGTLNAFYLGRTIPALTVRTGSAWSTIGNSSDILRYLWGTHGNEPRAAFLEPTAERLALEKRLDRCGVMLQIWIYYHLLDEPALTLRAWGIKDPRVPLWQRLVARPLFPLQRFLLRRSFRLNDNNYARAREYVDELLADVDTRLADGRQSILGGHEPNYTDFAFASMMGLWLQPGAYGGSDAKPGHLAIDERPPAMQADIERWKEDHPKAVRLVESLYEKHRFAEQP